jgi:hypothetical protein
MTDVDLELRARFRAALPPTDGRSCPEPAELWDAAAGALPFARSRALVEHASRCADCSEALRIARDVRAEAPAEAPAALPLRRRRELPVLAGLGLAAAVGAFLVLRPASPDLATVERGMSAAGTSEALRALSPDHQHPDAVVLRWAAYPGAGSYNVTVLTPELQVLHRAVGVSEAELQIPAAALRQSGTARELLWNVDAVLPDGRTVGSPTFRIRLE